MILRPGQAVRVKNDWPEASGPVHIRTPHYIRGALGSVSRWLGRFPNPEDLAFGRPAAPVELYHVSFDLASLWPDRPPTGAPGDRILVEVFGHWLEDA